MNKKAFTLVELLAVIVVLAIILIIAIPRVMNTIEESRKESFRITGENLVKGAADKATINALTNAQDKTYTIVDGEFVGDAIPMSGTLPDSATIVAKKDGSVSLVARKENYCVIKDFEDENVMWVGLDECELPGTVSAKTYGVTFNNATVGTRTDDAVGLTYTVNASTITSSFDTEDIYKDITEETDSYGNIFVKIPSFYIKKTKSVGNIWTYQITKDTQDSSYYLPECFRDSTTGDLLDYVLIGKYDASLNGTKLESKSGVAPLVSQNINTFRTYARNNGEGYQLIDIHTVDMLQALFYVEFATLDSQSIMYGYANANTSALASGTTNSVTTASGSPVSNTDGKNAMKYRGVENLYGNIWQFVDGINIQNNQTYVAKNPANYASDVFTGEYKQLGYVNANTNNYVLEMGYDTEHPYANYPILVGTYANSIYKDYYYQNTGNRIAFLGGYWDKGNIVGVSYWAFDLSSSNTSITVGSRLLKKAF